MKRVRTQPTDVAGCGEFRPNYQSMSSFLTYKTNQLDTNNLATYVGGILESDLQGGGTPEQRAAAQGRVNQNLDTLRLLEQKVASMSKCIQQDIIQKQTYSGKLYSLQQEIEEKEKGVNDMEQTAKEAEERAELLDKPYSKTTRWETWFPLGRPLRSESLPVLLSFALLFLTLSLGMFLRLASIQLRLDWLGFGSGSSYLSGYGIGR
jgi:hypothetical protein